MSQILYTCIPENRRPVHAYEVNCAGCNHLSDFSDEHRKGFCLARRRMVSTWHPVTCTGFTPLVRDRRLKVAWQGVVYVPRPA